MLFLVYTNNFDEAEIELRATAFEKIVNLVLIF